MKTIYSIYKFVNLINNKVYIGYTSNWANRLLEHQNRYAKQDTAFYYAIRKHGWNNFAYEVIYQSLDKAHTHKIMEEYFIREYDSHIDEGHGYNMSYGGDGNNGYCAETRFKMGSANRGKTRGPHSDDTKQKIGLANSIKKRTIEEKQHLSNINLGKKQSLETILKHSKSYIVISPEGKSTTIVNLSQFCRDNNLNQGAMAAIARGKLTQHKGWVCHLSTKKLGDG
jgi:group I intron endonuclease